MNKFWQWFYSYKGIQLQLSKGQRIYGGVLTIVGGICAAVSLYALWVLDDEIMFYRLGLAVLFCGWLVRGIIASDLSKQLKKKSEGLK